MRATTRQTRRTRGLLAATAVPTAVLVAASLATAPTTPAAAAPLPPTIEAAAADARIQARLAARLAAPALGRDVAVRVHRPGGGRVFAAQSHAAQLPASNMKLVTAFTALSALGPERRLPTRVVAGSAPRRVVLVGGGDPLLDAAGLRRLAGRTASSLAERGVPTGATVRVTVDDTLFPEPTRAVGWPASYGLGEISPVRALGRHGVRSLDTSAEAARFFVGALRERGVTARFAGRGETVEALGGDAAEELAAINGHRVATAVRQLLLVSDNQAAEVLFRHVALATGRPATWAGAGQAGRAVLRRAGLPVRKVRLADGSGLSRANRLSATLVERLVRRSSAGAAGRLAAVLPALPVSGVSGTLRHRYGVGPARCARGRVLAKTGFIDGVVALSGVARGVDGRDRTFSILANGIPSTRYSVSDTQRAVDRLAATITGCY